MKKYTLTINTADEVIFAAENVTYLTAIGIALAFKRKNHEQFLITIQTQEDETTQVTDEQ